MAGQSQSFNFQFVFKKKNFKRATYLYIIPNTKLDIFGGEHFKFVHSLDATRVTDRDQIPQTKKEDNATGNNFFYIYHFFKIQNFY